MALSAGQARAQDGEPDALLAASARAFFHDCLKFADEKQWQQAADRFRRALSIRWSPVLAYNLASVMDETGQLVEAIELLHRVELDDSAGPEQQRSARELRERMQPRLGRLTIELKPPADDVAVQLDGQPLNAVQLGAPIPADPGAHRVRVLRDGALVEEKATEVEAGQQQRIVVASKRVPTPAEVALAAQKRAELLQAAEADVTETWWFWASVGSVAAGAIATALILSLDEGPAATQDAASIRVGR